MSLFNPWVLLGIIMSVMSAFGSGYWKGSNDEVTRQQLEIAALNAEARQKEQVLVSAIQTQTAKLQKANQDAKLAQQKRNADIDNGTLKLRLAVKASECSISTATDTATTAGSNTGTTSAELDPTTSKSLVAITDEGDAAIRKLNTCITLYNEAYQTLKGKP
jgi:type II secretory pathway pseudopilin PulG